MSQIITLLYTKDKVRKRHIPQGQIFFRDKGYYIFPLDINGPEMEAITTSFKKFDSIDDLDVNSEAFSENAKKIIRLIKILKIKTCLLEHYSDWAGIPDDFFILIVKKNKIYPDTSYDSIEEKLGYFLSIKETPDTEVYKYYSTCEHLFYKT